MPNGQKKCQKWLSGGGSRLCGGEGRRGSHKKRKSSGQKRDKERSTKVGVKDV